MALNVGAGAEREVGTISVVVSSGSNTSAAIDINACWLSAIQMPSALTSTTITLQGSLDGSAFGDLADSTDTEISYSFEASKVVAVDKGATAGVRYLKIKTGSNEGADRTFSIKVLLP